MGNFCRLQRVFNGYCCIQKYTVILNKLCPECTICFWIFQVPLFTQPKLQTFATFDGFASVRHAIACIRDSVLCFEASQPSFAKHVFTIFTRISGRST